MRPFVQGLGDCDLTVGCLGGGGGMVLFLSSDIVDVNGRACRILDMGGNLRRPDVAVNAHRGSASRSSPSQPREVRVLLPTQQCLCASISSGFRLSRMAESQRNRPSNQWVHTVRAAMASDNSRTWFDAKVQEHGFDFLDDYLDRILAQAKQPQLVAFLCSSHRPTHIA